MAYASVGTKLQIGSNSIAELSSIGGLDLSADSLETTALDTVGGFRTFITGMKDAGEVPISGFFNPNDTNGQFAFYNAYTTNAVTNFTIIFPSTMGASWIFAGVVTKFSTSVETEDTVKFEGTIKVSGQPTLGVTASGDLTALALTGTSGSLSPAFAGTTYSYSYSFTGSSLTITPTKASATINLYVDGVFSQTITSGSASTSINFPAVGTKMLTLIYSDAGKTQKQYEVVANRTA
jgi:predicted secreted protein